MKYSLKLFLITICLVLFSINLSAKVEVQSIIEISIVEKMLLNPCHYIHSEYLQSYYNEFCYMYNRCCFGGKKFDRLLIAGINYKNEFKCNIK